MNPNEKNQLRLRRIVGVALFSALAYVVMLLIHFPVSFLTLDLKDAIIALCGLYFGPISALISSVIVAGVEAVTVSSTGVYGFVMNTIGTATFSVTVSVIYRWRKRFEGAIVGLLASVFAVTAVMMVFNLIVTPWYMHVEVAQVRSMIPTLLLPFNLVKATFNAAVVLLLYKPVSSVLQKTGFLPRSSATLKFDRRTILVTVAAVAIMAVSLVVIFRVLNGTFKFGI